MTNKEYSELTFAVSEKSNALKDSIMAFIIGGLICVVGQLIFDLYTYFGIGERAVESLTSITLITIAILLTGMNIYPRLSKFAGAGTLVPITGFANAMASPAIEHKPEGQVLGVAANMFKIAGPVIVFGLVASFVYGVILLIWRMF